MWRSRPRSILLLWPESLFDAGFQMSFAAVVALVSVYEALRGARRAWSSAARAAARVLLFFGGIVTSTLIASLAVAPFGIYHFHNTQQFAMLANLVAIPICNLVVMPAALATLVAMPFGPRGGAAAGDGLGHRGDGVAAPTGRRPAGRGRARAGDPDGGVRADGRGRAVVRAVEHALAAAGAVPSLRAWCWRRRGGARTC